MQNGDCVLHFKSKINCHRLFFLTKIHVSGYRRSTPDKLTFICDVNSQLKTTILKRKTVPGNYFS